MLHIGVKVVLGQLSIIKLSGSLQIVMTYDSKHLDGLLAVEYNVLHAIITKKRKTAETFI